MPESTDGDDRALTLRCEHCETVFTPADAHGIAIMGPGYAKYGCPNCSWNVRSVPPPSAERDTTDSDSDE